MKIQAISYTRLQHALATPYGDAQGLKTQRAALVLRIDTDDGLTGWGDISASRLGPDVSHLRQARELLIGRDPRHAVPLVRALAPFGPRIAAGFDIALADIRGKAAGMDLATLFGGRFREAQPSYASLQNASEAADVVGDAVAQAEQAALLGFRMVKMKVGWHDPATDAGWINAVLQALPADIPLAIDANRVLSLADAERLIRDIEACDRILWFEEPLSNRFPLAYRELRDRITVPVAGGESMPVAMLEQVIAGRMMDIVQPDLVGHGGFGPMRALLDLCDVHGVRLVPHCFDGQLLRIATLHLLASRPDWEERHGACDAAPVEVDISPNPLRDELLGGPLRPDGNGRLPVPQGPGLGVVIDEAFLARVGENLLS